MLGLSVEGEAVGKGDGSVTSSLLGEEVGTLPVEFKSCSTDGDGAGGEGRKVGGSKLGKNVGSEVVGASLVGLLVVLEVVVGLSEAKEEGG